MLRSEQSAWIPPRAFDLTEPAVLEPEPPGPDPNRREDLVIQALLRDAGRAHPSVRLGAGDDAALLADGTALTVDALVQGVHFDARLSPVDVGFKLVAVSVSDLAAMGARPQWMLLAASLPPTLPPRWIEELGEGLAEACARYELSLIGGDTTTTSGPAVLSATLGGRLVGEPVLRSTGRAGDILWVSGTLGLAGAGWSLHDPPPDALAALRRPDPPLAFALELARQGLATAMMDLSDGLSADLTRLCRASELGAEIDPRALPLHPALADLPDPLPLQVGGGEDYQLLFAAAPDAPVEELAQRYGVRLSPIGRLTREPEVRLRGRAWPAPLFSHFPEPDPRGGS